MLRDDVRSNTCNEKSSGSNDDGQDVDEHSFYVCVFYNTKVGAMLAVNMYEYVNRTQKMDDGLAAASECMKRYFVINGGQA